MEPGRPSAHHLVQDPVVEALDRRTVEHAVHLGEAARVESREGIEGDEEVVQTARVVGQLHVPGEQPPESVGAGAEEVTVLAATRAPGVPVRGVETNGPDPQHLLDVADAPDEPVEVGVRRHPRIHDAAELLEAGEVVGPVLVAQAEEPAVVLLVAPVPVAARARRRVEDASVRVAGPVAVVVDHETVVHLEEVPVPVLGIPEPQELDVRYPDVLPRRRDAVVDLPADQGLVVGVRDSPTALAVADQVVRDSLPGVAAVSVVIVQIELAKPVVERTASRHDDPETAVPAAASERAPGEAQARFVVNGAAPEQKRPVDQVVRQAPAAGQARFLGVRRVEAVVVKVRGRVRHVVAVDEVTLLAESGIPGVQDERVRHAAGVHRVAPGPSTPVRRGDEEDHFRVQGLPGDDRLVPVSPQGGHGQRRTGCP